MAREGKAVIRIGRNALSRDLMKLEKNRKANCPEQVIYFNDFNQLFSVLSAKKLELLQHLSGKKGKNVSFLSVELKRKKEAVSRDLHELARTGLIEIIKDGKKAYPRNKFDRLEIPLKMRA